MRNRESSCDWSCRLKIALIVLSCFISATSYAQYVVHRQRADYTPGIEKYSNKWVDISSLTPSFLSVHTQINNNALAFQVETNEYIYTFEEDDRNNYELLLDNIEGKRKTESGNYVIDNYLRKIVPSLGMEYVTTIKRHRNDVESTSSIPEPNEFEETETAGNVKGIEVESVDTLENIKNVASPAQDAQSIKRKNNVVASKEGANDKDKEGSSRSVLETIIGAFIILWIFKGVLKAIFSPSKKKKKNSWTDQAWFHDHNQKI